MNSKLIAIIIITCSAILGLLIGFNDNSYIKKETSSDNLTFSGDIISGDFSETFSGDTLDDSSGEIDNNIVVDNPLIDNSENIANQDPIEEIIPSVGNTNSSKNIPENVKAVYTTGWVMGTKKIRDSVITALKENGYNAIVIDIKDEAGQLSYNSSVQTAIDIKASQKMISNVTDVINELKAENFYVIGRIVTFKDPLYASKVNSIAYKKNDGTVWKDYNGNSWPNPYNTASWDYPIALAKEAAELGFDEIQFDYIRFPSSEGKTSTISYGFDRDTKTKSDVIENFLTKVMKEMEPYNVVISADVFGITTKRDGDFENIGQDFSRIASIVDVVCPMVYPSHYYYNEYKIAKPDKNPYEIVYYSMEDAFERYESYKTLHSGDSSNIKLAKIRPYIQDFTASWLGNGNYLVYGDKEVTKQIQALYDLGIYDFCLWDPSNKYCYTAIKNAVIKELSGDI